MPVTGSSLQRFNRLDLLVLDGSGLRARGAEQAGWLSSGRWQFPVRDRLSCPAKAADIAVALWNVLPGEPVADEAARPRCYTPGFALQFFAGTELALSVGLCFVCEIAYLDGPAATMPDRELPMASTRTRALLRLCREVSGREAESTWPDRFLERWIKGHG